MAKYNKTFELSPEDMDLIEAALRIRKRELNAELLEQSDPLQPCETARGLDAETKQINDLLGRLHNQKVFYRPKQGAYVSG